MSSRKNRRRTRDVEIPELNVTPFMNLMIVLVPVLLLSLVFTHTTVIELDFPAATSGSTGEVQHLEVTILKDELIIADQRGVLKRLPKVDGEHDFVGLNTAMLTAKQQMPNKRDALILLEPDTDYQALVFVMDSIRFYRAPGQSADQTIELFPDMSLGDAAQTEAEGTS